MAMINGRDRGSIPALERLDGLFDEPRPWAPRRISGADVERVMLAIGGWLTLAVSHVHFTPTCASWINLLER